MKLPASLPHPQSLQPINGSAHDLFEFGAKRRRLERCLWPQQHLQYERL